MKLETLLKTLDAAKASLLTEPAKAGFDVAADALVPVVLENVTQAQATIERQAVAIDALKRLLEATYLHESHETGFDTPEEYAAFMMKSLNKDVEAILNGESNDR